MVNTPENVSFKISIIIPTFNSGAYLTKCLESIRFQNDNNIEVIVIDGCSLDNTIDIIKMNLDLVNIFISEKDSGQGDAVTKGIRLATGEVLHWHASDDLMLPRALDRVRHAFITNPNAKLVISDGLALLNNRIVRTGACRWLNYRVALFHYGRFQSDCAYWKRSISYRGLPLDISQPLSVDEDFFLKIWSNEFHCRVKSPLGLFRVRSGQLSTMLSRDQLKYDRLRTRKFIFVRDNISYVKQKALKIFTFPEHIMRNIILHKIYYFHLFILRKIYHNNSRYDMAKKMYQFDKSTDLDNSRKIFNEIGDIELY